MLKLAAAIAAFLPAIAAAQAPAGPTLSAVRGRGMVECSASVGTPGFGMFDKQGIFQGLDADTCRAVAAAVFGDPAKVKFDVLNGAQRITALQTGQVDLTVETLTLESIAGGFGGVGVHHSQLLRRPKFHGPRG